MITVTSTQLLSKCSHSKGTFEFDITSEHPRLIASIPTAPVPLYKSNQRPGLRETGHPPAT